VNITKRPSADSMGCELGLFPWAPPEARDARTVVPAAVSCTNTSREWLVSPGTRASSYESKATIRPSADSAGTWLGSVSCEPSGARDTWVVSPVARSWTNTSATALVSPATWSLAVEV